MKIKEKRFIKYPYEPDYAEIRLTLTENHRDIYIRAELYKDSDSTLTIVKFTVFNHYCEPVDTIGAYGKNYKDIIEKWIQREKHQILQGF